MPGNQVRPTNPFTEFKQEDIEQSIPARFEQMVEKYPDRLAVKTQEDEITYQELNQLANRIARAILAQRGDGEESVAMLLSLGATMIATTLGILKAGKSLVPLDPTFPADRMKNILQNSQSSLMVTCYRDFPSEKKPDQIGVPLMNIEELEPSLSGKNVDLQISPERNAHIMYTSGSTGEPKGVLMNHRSVLNYTMNPTNQFHISAMDRLVLLYMPSGVGAFMDIFLGILNGAALYPLDIREKGMTPLADWLIHQEITVYSSFASLFRYFANSLTGEEAFPNLRLIHVGGEPVRTKDVELYKKHFPHDCIFVNRYGSSELGNVIMYFIDKATPSSGSLVPIGFPIGSAEVLLLDEEGKEVGVNQIGEMAVKSRYNALGYWKKPDLTQAKFLSDPEGGEETTFLTGDLGSRLPDGCLVHHGRKDTQVKIRGYRIEVAEIEMALLGLETIKEAVIIDHEDVSGDDKRLVAYLVSSSTSPPTVSELRRILQNQLPDYMIPSAFVILETIPLTSTGKVNRKALPPPGTDRPDLEIPYSPPSNVVEEELVKIWGEVLGLEVVGVNDPFLELGGDSLRATQVISRILDSLEMEVPMQSLMRAPTVVSMAQIIMHQIFNKSAPKKEKSKKGHSITRREESTSCALSFAQERLWFLDQLEGSTSAYNLFRAYRLQGSFNKSVLKKALQAIVARHDSIRTTFRLEGEVPVQVIDTERTIELEEVDLRGSRECASEEELQRSLRLEADCPFDLSRDLMLRAKLFRLEGEEHVLLLVMHHIASDGWSMGVLCRELSEFYMAYAVGRLPDLQELPTQYADYAAWQREWLQGERFEKQLSYWKKQLQGIPLLELPTDRPRPPRQTFRGAKESFFLSEELTTALKSLNRREACTLFMTLLAAFQTFLHRYTGQHDIVVGAPIAGRNQPQIEHLIGFFLNNLVLRTDLSGNPTFCELLGRVREVTLGAYEHQDIPFEKLLEELNPERDLSRTPLFQVSFNMFNFADIEFNVPGLVVDRISFPDSPSNYDLTLYLKEQDRGIYLDWVYNIDLFDEITISSMAKQFRTLLENIASDPDQRLSDLDLFTESERKLRFAEKKTLHSTKPFAEFTKEAIEQSIPDRFREQAKKYPQNIAIKTRNYEWTYEMLDGESNRVSQAILELCGPSEERVGLLFDHDAPMITGILGALKAGKSYVPLDPEYPLERLAFVLADSEASTLLTDSANEALGKELTKDKRKGINIEKMDSVYWNENSDHPISPESLAYILYTSGSMGHPKGVIQNHRNVLHHIKNYTNALRIGADDKVTLLSSYGFDAAIMDIFGALLNGATLYPIKIKEERVSDLHRFLIEEEITIYHSTPTGFRFLFSNLPEGKKFPQIRFVVLGGEEVYKRDVDLYKKHFSPDSIFINGLGPSESTLALQYFINHETPITRNTVPVGYPVDDMNVALLDESGRDAGVYGEIAIQGPQVALGYWRKFEITKEAFLTDSNDETQRIYRTGDMGRLLPNGAIEYAGRKDVQVKIRGFRIEPGEIESKLAQYPAVHECVVIGHVDSDAQTLVAYLTADGQHHPSPENLRKHLADKLPQYMVPNHFIILDAIPRTPNGKIDREALPKLVSTQSDLKETYLAPRNPIEETLAEIWAEVLKLDRVGIRDNFFDLGGHSLMATQIITRLCTKMKVELPLISIFELPTIADLALLISSHPTYSENSFLS